MQSVLKELPAIVQQAEDVAAISKLAREVASSYTAALKARRAGNVAGLEIGRAIIAACFDAEVVARVTTINCKEVGSATKVYSWVSKQLAGLKNYNANYLAACARQYLAVLNKHRAEQNKAALDTDKKIGVFATVCHDFPAVGELEQYLLPTNEPRIDIRIGTPEDGEPDQNADDNAPPPPSKVGEQLALSIIARAHLRDSVNPSLVRGLIKGLSPVLERHGYSILQTKKEGK